MSSRRAAPGRLDPTAGRLLAARFCRSLGQGALVVDLSLYLHALGWSGSEIGLVLTGGGLAGALLSLVIGLASDRLRRKPFLLGYEVLTLAVAFVALSTTVPALLAPALVLGGFGRGINGAAGPFAPAEQAWLAQRVAPALRGGVYSVNVALGFAGMAAGALAAMLPALWLDVVGAAAYRPVFLLPAAGALANLALLWRGEEHRAAPVPGATSPSGASSGRRVEDRRLRRLVSLNAVNGLAIGLTGPLIAYWFSLRFGVGPGLIAPMMAAGFALTAVSALVTGRLSRRLGLVRSVVWARSGALAGLVILPLVPVFWLASVVQVLRSALGRGSLGARQALVVSLVEDERRGLAVSVNAASFQLPQAVGPTVAGSLIGAGHLALPFYLGALLQAVYLVGYARLFRDVEGASAAPS